MSFTNTPISRLLVTGVVCSSLLASLLDVKHYLYIQTDLHLWQYGQLWRLFTFQLGWTNSSEVLFGAMALYHLRVVERLWGSRKYASFLLTSYFLTSLLLPTLFAALIAPLTGGIMTYIPAGPVPLLFAAYAQYSAIVPHLYQYQLVFKTPFSSFSKPASSSGGQPSTDSSAPPTVGSSTNKITLTDRLPTHFLLLQSVLFQFPSSLPGALVGYAIGQAFRNDMLPSRLTKWRVPRWLVGSSMAPRRNEGFEGLQRRLEGEGATGTGSSTGILASSQQQNAGRRRGWLDTVRGAF